MKTVALIPARSGSKSIRDKNIRLVGGKPLLAHSIDHALASAAVDRVFVSTDSEEYRRLAVELGAEAPFLRPEAISGDMSTDLEVFRHFILWLREQGDAPEYLVHLRPTHPVRDPHDIDRMVELLATHPDADAVRSLSPATQTPYKMWLFQEDGEGITPAATCTLPEAYNSPRQALPEVYAQNACIDVTRNKTVMEHHSMTGKRILGYILPYFFDIDTNDELVKADLFLTVQAALRSGKPLKLCFDIDGIIAEKTSDNNYARARPLLDNIGIINVLYDRGHHVMLYTARGSEIGLDWKAVTTAQMQEWGVRYHELRLGKPNADLYIDDKNCSLAGLRELFSSAAMENALE
ncbi:MAG: acylneuraminate cytidylyltransferase family protein [Planctomycetes bacterium]|nr:acylneuraminate cytidylyltransferase family protein [Planctomycetota bacterium]